MDCLPLASQTCRKMKSIGGVREHQRAIKRCIYKHENDDDDDDDDNDDDDSSSL